MTIEVGIHQTNPQRGSTTAATTTTPTPGNEARPESHLMALNSIAKEFRRFADMIFKGDQPSPTQIEEMKTAFFAGAFTIVRAMEEVGEPHISEEHGIRYFENRREECEQFYKQLTAEQQAKESGERKELQYMTEPELKQHISRQIEFLKCNETIDTIGSMLIIFQKDGITQYGATIDPETAPDALRELADRLERRDTVQR